MKRLILLLSLATIIFASDIQSIDREVRFEHKNGTLIDHFAKMQWQDDKDSKTIRKAWQGAKKYCSNLTLDGKSDWRLPTAGELDYAYEIQDSFKNLVRLNYNSTHTDVSGTSRAWGRYFGNDPDYFDHLYPYYYVRCVRSEKKFNHVYSLKRYVRKNRDKAIQHRNAIYKKIKLKNDIRKYEWFVEKYPSFPQIKEVKKKLYKLTFNKTKNINTIDAYANFADKYPQAPQTIEAIQNIYKFITQRNQIGGYEWFIQKYPKAPQAKDALHNCYSLVKSQNNIAGYEWFIKTYPDAPQVKDAISKIHQLAFNEAKKIDTISAYNTFIISYPMAKEVKEANALAKELERYKYTDTLPSWVRKIMPNFLADILNKIFGIFSSDEKKSRALLIKAKQIERQGHEYYGVEKAGYVIIANRMYDLLQEEYNDTDATLRFLESEEFKDFIETFKDVMRSVNDRLDNISRYSSEILEASKQGLSEASADRAMSEYNTKEYRKWQKFMHLRDKGYN